MTNTNDALEALDEKILKYGDTIALYSVLGQWVADNLETIRAALTNTTADPVGAQGGDVVERVAEFARQWKMGRINGDEIFNIHLDPNAEMATLSCNDLLLLCSSYNILNGCKK